MKANVTSGINFLNNQRSPVVLEYLNYPVKEIQQNPQIFIISAKQIFNKEKAMSPIHKPMDLTNADDLKRMRFYVIAHCVTGLLEFGTSNTLSIPYWDTQAYAKGMEYQIGAFEDDYQLLLVESLNVLRGYLYSSIYYVSSFKQLHDNIESFYQLGKVSFTDLSNLASLHLSEWTNILTRFRKVALAKVKYALYIIDQIINDTLRKAAFEELTQIINRLQFRKKDLNVDLCIEGGLSKETSRPSYKISMFVQLKHLQKSDYVIKYNKTFNYSFYALAKSILRKQREKCIVQNPCFDTLIPWKF